MPLHKRTFGFRSASEPTSSYVRRRCDCRTTPAFSCPSSRRRRYVCRVSSVVDESSMSMRTKVPYVSARPTRISRLSWNSSTARSSPSAVGFTLMFESSRCSAIESSASRYACTIACASSGFVTSSPRTSIVARFPFALSRCTTRSASWSVSPAMYRSEKSWTTGFGTAGSRRTMARSSSVKAPRSSTLAHEALAGRAHERNGLREQDAHRVPQGDRLLVDAALRLDLLERRSGELDRGVEREGGELLALRLGDALGLLLRELAETAHQVLRIAPEGESESSTSFHAPSLAVAVLREDSVRRPSPSLSVTRAVPCSPARPRLRAPRPPAEQPASRRRTASRSRRRARARAVGRPPRPHRGRCAWRAGAAVE